MMGFLYVEEEREQGLRVEKMIYSDALKCKMCGYNLLEALQWN